MAKAIKKIVKKSEFSPKKVLKILPRVDLKKVNLKNKYVFPVILALGVLGLLYLGKGLIFAAFVNGRPVFRTSVIKDLEVQYGQEALSGQIEKVLIAQEVKKLKVEVSKEIIAAEITRIEGLLSQQGTDLDTALATRGQTRAELEDQIKLQKEIEAIVGPEVTVSDEEISTYYTENKDYFGATTKLADVKTDIYDQLFQQKLVTEYNTWITGLKAQAKILYVVNY
jgi:hypothetical protein